MGEILELFGCLSLCCCGQCFQEGTTNTTPNEFTPEAAVHHVLMTEEAKFVPRSNWNLSVVFEQPTVKAKVAELDGLLSKYYIEVKGTAISDKSIILDVFLPEPNAGKKTKLSAMEKREKDGEADEKDSQEVTQNNVAMYRGFQMSLYQSRLKALILEKLNGSVDVEFTRSNKRI